MTSQRLAKRLDRSHHRRAVRGIVLRAMAAADPTGKVTLGYLGDATDGVLAALDKAGYRITRKPVVKR